MFQKINELVISQQEICKYKHSAAHTMWDVINWKD